MESISRWLFKTDPHLYSFADLLQDRRTVWDGVTNAQALQFLRRVATTNRVLIYHTGDEKAIVGTAVVVRGAYQDPKVGDPRRVVVDLRAETRLKHPVPLSRIKSDVRFADLLLVRNSRLSVMPIPDESWSALMELEQS